MGHGLALQLRAVATEHGAERHFAQIGARDGGAVAAHQHHPMRPQRARQRRAFLRFDHQHVGVAELVPLIPERHVTHRGREVENRHHLLSRDGEGQNGVGVMMHDRIDLGAGLVNLAVDHALTIEAEFGRPDRLGIQIEFDDVGHLRQFRRAVARDEKALRIIGVAHADVPERVEHVLVGENARSDDQFVQSLCNIIRHLDLRFCSVLACGMAGSPDV